MNVGQKNTTRCRCADASDAVELSRFAQRTFSESYAAANRPEDFKRHLADNFGLLQQRATLSNPGVETLLCHVTDQLAGYVELWLSPVPECVGDDNLLEIRRFYVDRPWQGTGVAAVLMDAVFDSARNKQASGLWLGVWEHAPRAKAFYSKSGFAKVGQQIFKMGFAMQTDHIMVRRFEN